MAQVPLKEVKQLRCEHAGEVELLERDHVTNIYYLKIDNDNAAMISSIISVGKRVGILVQATTRSVRTERKMKMRSLLITLERSGIKTLPMITWKTFG